MPRRIFAASSVTNTTGAPLRLTFHANATTNRRETDLWTIDGSNNLAERIPNGIILTNSSGAYSAFAGPEDVGTLYCVKHDSVTRTTLTSSGSVAGSATALAADLADSSVTTAKILDATIAIADLSATGTPSSSTFLRGDNTWSAVSGSGDKLGLTLTAVKTSNYSASAGDFVPVDTTSGNVTVTFPTAPADGTVVAVKHVIRGGTNTVPLALGGSDVFNKAGGATTGTLTLVSQGIVAQYKATGAIWYVVADDLPLSGLDSRYAQVSNNLSDVTAATARTNLGLGGLATLSTITTSEITDGTITTSDVDTTSFDARYRLASATITSADITDGTIATADLADSAVTTAKIADGTIAVADMSAAALVGRNLFLSASYQ